MPRSIGVKIVFIVYNPITAEDNYCSASFVTNTSITVVYISI